MKTSARPVLPALALLGASVLAAPASVMITVEETMGDTVFGISGSIDTIALGAPDGTGSSSGFGGLFSPGIANYPAANTRAFWALASVPDFAPNFRNNGLAAADQFAVNGTNIVLAESYVSGSPISASLTFAGEGFDDLGLEAGSYVWTLTNDETVTLTVPGAEVPLPAGLSLRPGGLALPGLARRC